MSDSLKAALKAAVPAVLALVLCFALAMGLAGGGCEDSETGTTASSGATGTGDSSLVGKWASATLEETWEFAADGTMTITREGAEPLPFTYSTESGTLVLTVDGSAEGISMGYSVDDDVLTIDDPELGATAYDREE